MVGRIYRLMRRIAERESLLQARGRMNEAWVLAVRWEKVRMLLKGTGV